MTKDLGKIAYDGYWAGVPLAKVPWEDLPEGLRFPWRSAADAVMESVTDAYPSSREAASDVGVLPVGTRVRAIRPAHGCPVRRVGTLGTVAPMPPRCPGYDAWVVWDDKSDPCPVEAGQYEVEAP